jgi:hypothetical protein
MGKKQRHPTPRAAGAPVAPPPVELERAVRPWLSSALAPVWVLLAVAVVLAATHTDPAGVDTWVSLAGGREIHAHGITLADPFSFASRQPAPLPAGAGIGARAHAWLLPAGWINQNWLTHVFFAAVMRHLGLDGLVAWKYANYTLVALVLVLTARLRRAEPALALLLTAGALLAGRTFFEIRAQEWTNLLAAALMLILATSVLRSQKVLYLTVPLFAVWCNLHGGFIWGLVALATFAGANVLAAWLRGPLLAPGPRALRAQVLAFGAALVTSVVASPYRLTNLTHSFVTSLGANARQWRNVYEWQPLRNGTASEQAGFAIAALLAAGAAAVVVVRQWRRLAPRSRRPADAAGDAGGAFDLGSAAVLALTAAMAVTSRRFLPMAYLTGAPLLAEWLTRALRPLPAVRALADRWRDATAAGGPLRPLARTAAWLAAAGVAAAVLVPLARTMLGPSPYDDRRVSVGDRMLQTVGQPWDACRFVRLNRLHGRMWNFWETGGFWGWCQDQDPASGKIAMQTTIDGRAQAAFDIDAALWYNQLLVGGPAALQAEREHRLLTEGELAAVAPWTAAELSAHGIWLAHLTQSRADEPLSRSLLALPSWQVVYADAHHLLLADTSTASGRALSEAVDAGTASFPDDASRLLTLAYRALRSRRADKNDLALSLARQAYAARPSQRAVEVAILSASESSTTGEVASFCEGIASALARDHRAVAASNGGYERLAAGVTALGFLEQTAVTRGDAEAHTRAAQELDLLAGEANRLVARAEW